MYRPAAMSLFLAGLAGAALADENRTPAPEDATVEIIEPVDGAVLMGGSGRYIDRFERRDGVWKIALRRLVIDWRFKADGVVWEGPAPGAFPEGRWDREDLTYQRPLVLDR